MSGETFAKEIPAVMVAGGRPFNPAAIAAMISKGFGGIEKPFVAYIGTANNDNPVFYHLMKSMIKKAGAGKISFVHLAKKKPELDAARKTLANADVIFLSGGEVEDGMNWLKKHDLVGFLKELYSKGKRFVGVSAGVIMMGTHWVRWGTEGDDSTSELFECLAFTPVLFDVHGEDENWVELKAALKLLGPGAQGYGLPGGCMISADSKGNLKNLEKEFMVFINEGGNIRVQ